MHHNPNIDWSKGMVAFSRCPESCGLLKDADASEDLWEGQGVKDGDHIFAFNAEGYLKERTSFKFLCLVQLHQSLALNNTVKQCQKFEELILASTTHIGTSSQNQSLITYRLNAPGIMLLS
jgi:hypothetical protein